VIGSRSIILTALIVEDPVSRPKIPLSKDRFNGATTLESWKTSRLADVKPPRRMLQWGHDVGVVEDTLMDGPVSGPLPRFNGATTLESWKTKKNCLSRRRHWRFNGATTLESWKTRPRPSNESAGFALQWGHDVGVVEDTVTNQEPKHEHALQWGHDVGVVEDLAIRNPLPCNNTCFNGATTLESWKTRPWLPWA
jgi:hypothetical protein